MSEQGANIEKLLERYVTGDLTDTDRELVEQYLTGPGVDAARAREDLRFENLLLSAFEVPFDEKGIADAVLERVFQRPLPESRKTFKGNVALTLLKEAEAAGRISHRKSQFWNWRVRRIATMAACLTVFVAAMWVNASMNQSTQPLNPGVVAPIFVDSVGSVAYFDDTGSNTSDPIPVIPVGRVADNILPGDDIKTDQGEAALIKMKGGGIVFVQPLSRVQIIRAANGQKLSLKVLEGALKYDFSAANGAVTLESAEGHRGRLKGNGQITLASRPIGGSGRPVLEGSLSQILLVRVHNKGYAIFQSSTGAVRIQGGQLGVVSPETVLTVSDSKKSDNPRAGILNPKKWSLDKIIAQPEEPAIQVAQRLLLREDVVHEALRVFEFELIDMIAASFAIEVELKHLGCTPNTAELAEARRFVANDELMQVIPLRSADAQRTRVDHVAGLMAIDRAHREKRKTQRPIESISQLRQRVLSQIFKRMKISRSTGDEQIAFQVDYRDQSKSVVRAETWSRLRQFIRRSELARVVKRLSEKTILDIWLENRNLDWPELPDAANFPLIAVAQMAGLTRVQLQDQLRIESLVVRNTQAPSMAQVERFMKEKVTKRRRLLFDHYFFPTTDPFRGTPYSKERIQKEHARAKELVTKLRLGQEILPEDTAASVPRYGASLWVNGRTGGPKPWWNEIYGRKFSFNVKNLSEGEVSNPIGSSEGFHVVVMKHEGEDRSDPRSHKNFAEMTYRFEVAREMFEKEVALKTRLICPLEDIMK